MNHEAKQRKTSGAQFIAVRGSRNRRLPGLYSRNGRFYGQLWVDKEDGTKTARKFPLLDPDDEPVTTLNAAKKAMEVLRNTRRENALPTTGHKPRLADYVETYFAKAEVGQKKPRTLASQLQALKRWKAHLGDVRIDRITQPMISTFKDKRPTRAP